MSNYTEPSRAGQDAGASAALQGGELLLRCLEAEGNTHIFAVADVGYNPVMREGRRYGQTFIGPRHESAGVHMAEGLARVTGRPGVVMAGMGPGVANMLPGVVCADIEGIPVIVIGTQRSRRTHSAVKRGRFQYTPQFDLFRPAVRYAKAVEEARRIPEVMREAYRAATTGRAGPVYVEIPIDVMNDSVPVEPGMFPDPASYRFAPGAGDPEAVESAARALVQAERPLVVAGSGIYRARAQEAFRAFVRRHGLPVIPSFGARGALSDDDPLALSMVTPAAQSALAAADVVLVLASSIGEPLGFGRPGTYWGEADAKTWIQVDADPAALGYNRPIDIGIVGDVRRVMQQLDEAIADLGGRKRENGLAELCAESHRTLASLRQQVRGQEGVPIHPGRMVAEVRDFFPRDSIVCWDGGNTTLWSMHFNGIYDGELLWTSKFGHLGTGLPYAMGAKLARPDRTVYLVSGDGAFGFNIQELETCARHGIGVVSVINCDYQWAMEIPGQTADFGSREACVGVDHSHARYDLVAQGFGCHGEYVTEPGELFPALQRAAESGGPAVVQVVTDPKANEFPPGLLMVGNVYGDDY
jgi:acetolactate synthase-1/2/3 large subunit